MQPLGGKLTARRERLANLDTIIVEAASIDHASGASAEAGSKPTLLAAFCHGFGAPGTDLVGLAVEYVERQPELAHRVRFLFPAAPIVLDEYGGGARAWWPLNIAALQAVMQLGSLDEVSGHVPPGLTEAVTALTETLNAARRQAGLPWNRVVVGGFSQGAMLATATALSLPESPAGLVVMSGMTLDEPTWKAAVKSRLSMPILQSHGRADAILPFPAGRRLADLFSSAGCDAMFVEDDGPHGIAPGMIEATADFLAHLADADDRPSET